MTTYVKPFMTPRDNQLPKGNGWKRRRESFSALLASLKRFEGAGPSTRDGIYHRLMRTARRLEDWDALVRRFSRSYDLRRSVYEKFLERCPVDGCRRDIGFVMGAVLLATSKTAPSVARIDAGWYTLIDACAVQHRRADWAELVDAMTDFGDGVIRPKVRRAFLLACPHHDLCEEFCALFPSNGKESGREHGFCGQEPKFMEARVGV